MAQKIKKTITRVGYALMNTNESTGAITYGTPVWFISTEAGGRKYSAEPNGELQEIYADGVVVYSAEENNGYDITLTLLAIIDDIDEKLLGNVVTAAGVAEYASPVPRPRFALFICEETTDAVGQITVWYTGSVVYTNSQSVSNLTSTNNGTVTLYARWTENTLSVNYNANGGTTSSETYKIINNLMYNVSDNTLYAQKWTYNVLKSNGLVNASTFGLEKTGYIFSGYWGTTSTGGTKFRQEGDAELLPETINSSLKTGNCSITLYALWEARTYTVTLNANGGTGGTSSVTATYDSNMPSITIPTRTGYKFEGYYDTSASTGGTQYYTATEASASRR